MQPSCYIRSQSGVHWRGENRVNGNPQVSDVGDLGNTVVGVCAKKDGERGGRFPKLRPEHLLGLFDRFHSPTQGQEEEISETEYFENRKLTIYHCSVNRTHWVVSKNFNAAHRIHLLILGNFCDEYVNKRAQAPWSSVYLYKRNMNCIKLTHMIVAG